MDLFEAGGTTLILTYFWPLIVGVIVLIFVFKMAGSLAQSDMESDAAERAQVLFVRRAFWTGIGIVVLCIIVWYLPEIKDHFENFFEAAQNAKEAITE